MAAVGFQYLIIYLNQSGLRKYLSVEMKGIMGPLYGSSHLDIVVDCAAS